ncbi:hypothetical protein D3C71_1430530 [compost metagenome]
MLETKLGSALRVRECFLANAKRTNEGEKSLFPKEVIDADAYHLASMEAEAAAKLVLNREDVGFLVKLGLPVH